MSDADCAWARTDVPIVTASYLWPGSCETASWPGRADVRFGWTLEKPGHAQAISAAELCFRLADKLDLQFACLRQVHGDTIVDADTIVSFDLSDPPVGDGLVSLSRGRLIGVGVADCAPLFLAFRGGLMVLHAGWRGVVARILPGALALIERRWDVSPGDVELILGPCIGPCCFAVSSAVAALFPAHVRRRHRTDFHIDLPGTLLDQWLSSGGLAAHFMRLDRCTVCGTPTLHSHRRAPNRGRNFGFIYRLEIDDSTPI